MEFSIKAYLQNKDSSEEVRRIPISTGSQKSIYQVLLSQVIQSFPGLKEKSITLKWKDSDADYVLMSSDEEVMEALSQSSQSLLKVYITVEGDKEPTDHTDHHHREFTEDSQNEEPSVVNSIPLFSSPPPNFPGPKFSYGKKRRHHKPFGGYWAFEEQFPFGGHRFFGRDTSQSHCPFHDQGHFGKHGPFGRGGMHSSFSHGPFGGFGHGPFGGFGHGPFGVFDHGPFGVFGHAPFFQQTEGIDHCLSKKSHEDSGWKGKLRDAVPVAHRRWAKIYIRNWRVANLKNATTTSSDSDQDWGMNDTSSVPEAYAKWLNFYLPKWHKKWDQTSFEAGSRSDDDEQDKCAEGLKFKNSVPMEFRKWTKWYMARHFGKKDAPKFRDDDEYNWGYRHRKDMKHGGKKMWKKAYKMHFLCNSVPLKFRIWAREFIRDWRQQNNVSDPASGTSSESDSTDQEKLQGNIIVPNDYSTWLSLFLAKWHIKRGLINVQKSGKIELAYLKHAVPWDLRKWVKCYLWRRFWSNNRDKSTACQYQQWLAAFQKKWLTGEAKETDVLRRSNKEATTASDKEVEKSFKKLRLEEEKAQTKSVSFSSSEEDQQVGAEGKVVTDSDQGKKISPGFRHWAQEALRQWDGKTAGDTTDEDIPPHIYHWMSQFMVKMEMKKRKKQMKEAHKEMKAATKAHKYFHT